MKLYIIDSDLYFHFEEGEKEKESQIKYKLNGRKYMVMVRVEINEIGKNKEKWKPKVWLGEKINIIEKSYHYQY